MLLMAQTEVSADAGVAELLASSCLATMVGVHCYTDSAALKWVGQQSIWHSLTHAQPD